MKKFLISILIILTSNFALASDIDDLRWIAQDYPPYAYIDDNGHNAGPVINLVAEILKKSGSSKTIDDIKISTFSKMFIFSNNKEDAVFFPLAKTPDRESYFKWVGPIFVNKPVIYAKAIKRSTDKGLTGRKPIQINQIEDLKNYTILGRDKYTGVTQLQDADVSVQSGDSDQENFLKLKDDQVQMVVCDKSVGQYLIKNLELTAEDYQIVYELEENDMNFAFNKDTDDDLINQVKTLLKTTKMKDID